MGTFPIGFFIFLMTINIFAIIINDVFSDGHITYPKGYCGGRIPEKKELECSDKHLKEISRLYGGIVLLYIEGRTVD